MKITRIHQKLTMIALALAVVVFASSCKEEEIMEPEVISAELQEQGFTVLSAAITAAGLQDDLAGMGAETAKNFTHSCYIVIMYCTTPPPNCCRSRRRHHHEPKTVPEQMAYLSVSTSSTVA